MTDEECIAIAMLHGCEFYCADGLSNRWYVSCAPAHTDPVSTLLFHRTSWYGAASRIELARTYCEVHKLLPEVTHEG